MIYVDPMMKCLVSARWPYREACHLFCDAGELDTLQTFARRLGLRREWFQDHRDLPHYDLNVTRREAAVRLGAVAADHHKTVAVMNEWRQWGTRAGARGGSVDGASTGARGARALPGQTDARVARAMPAQGLLTFEK